MSPKGSAAAGTRTTSTPAQVTRVTARPLLVSGILSSLVYVLADQICAARYPGYRQLDQAISELSAIGALTAGVWSAFMPIFSLLLLGFAVGVLRAGKENHRLRATGILLLVFIFSGPFWAIVPMHQRGSATAWQDAGHLVMGALSLALMLAVVIAGAAALDRPFRAFSLVTAFAILTAGLTTFAYTGRVAAGQATPWLGLIERVMLYGFLLWVATLAAALLRGRPAEGGSALRNS